LRLFRRRIRSALAAGALVATSRLPSFADNPALFPKRGKFERILLAYVHIDAGSTRPLRPRSQVRLITI